MRLSLLSAAALCLPLSARSLDVVKRVEPHRLLQRQTQVTCPDGYQVCGPGCILATDACCNSAGVSCPVNYHCDPDPNGNIGCCQDGATCVGYVNATETTVSLVAPQTASVPPSMVESSSSIPSSVILTSGSAAATSEPNSPVTVVPIPTAANVSAPVSSLISSLSAMASSFTAGIPANISSFVASASSEITPGSPIPTGSFFSSLSSEASSLTAGIASSISQAVASESSSGASSEASVTTVVVMSSIYSAVSSAVVSASSVAGSQISSIASSKSVAATFTGAASSVQIPQIAWGVLLKLALVVTGFMVGGALMVF